MHLAVTVVFLLALAGDAGTTDSTSKCILVEKARKSQKEMESLRRLDPLVNTNFSVTDAGEEGYTYVFRVCGDAGTIPEGGLVQKDKDGKETIVGKYTVTEVTGGSDWVMLVYLNGSEYRTHCGKERRKAIIMISCSPGTLKGNLEIVHEEREREEDCFYLFELDSSAVCPVVPSKLSLGSIFLIVCVSCLAVYLIGGFLYQRLIVGAKGMEQFPNLSFWQEIGNLAADGCNFVCRSRGSQDEPPTYRGVATEPLGEEPEERDDHLLPM